MPRNDDTPKTVSPVLSIAQMDQVVKTTAQILAAQPKQRVKLRKLEDPKALNYETVQVNGHTFQIMRGVEVEVPQTVYDILVESGLY